MNRYPSALPDAPPTPHDPAETSSRRALARMGAKLAFVIPAAVALKVNVASAGPAPAGTGVD